MFEKKSEKVYGAGSLHEEIQELKKAVSDNDELEIYDSTTRNCGGFLTLFCC